MGLRQNVEQYLKNRWNIVPSPPISTFYFQGAPSKSGSNPIFSADSTYDYAKAFHTVLGFGATDYRMWYGCLTIGGALNIAYATSTDGITWTKPTLNQVSFGGNTNNNLFYASGVVGGSVYYDAAGASGQKFLMVLEAGSGFATLIGSEDGVTSWTIVKEIYTLPDYLEAKCVTKRADGRFAVLYTFGHSTGSRSIGMFTSNTTDPAGSWTDQGAVGDLAAASSATQFYSLMITQYSGVWLGLVTRYNGVTDITSMDLWQSNNEGFNWTQSVANWIPLGAGAAWDSKQMYAGNIVQVGSEWRAYYVGGADFHNNTNHNQIGYAVVTP